MKYIKQWGIIKHKDLFIDRRNIYMCNGCRKVAQLYRVRYESDSFLNSIYRCLDCLKDFNQDLNSNEVIPVKIEYIRHRKT